MVSGMKNKVGLMDLSALLISVSLAELPLFGFMRLA
jgi:hypothetical protein